MTLFETIADSVRPEGSKPVIQMIIEKSGYYEFDCNADAIECHADDRLFIYPIQDHELKTEWIRTQEDSNPYNEDNYDRADVDTINQDKEFLQQLFFKNISHVEELT